MKHIKTNILRYEYFLLMGVFLMISGCTGLKTTTRANIFNPEPVDQQPLRLTLQSTKPRYVLGEPVYLRVELKNTSRKSIPVYPSLSPETGVVTIQILTPENEKFVFIPLSITDNYVEAHRLEPGESLAAVFPAFFGGRGWTFDRVGSYQVTAAYKANLRQGARSHMVSKPLQLTFGKEQQEVGRFLIGKGADNMEAGKFLTWQAGDQLKKGQALLKKLTERYPKSTVASYVWYALGKSQSDSFTDFSRNVVRPYDCNQTQRYFDKVRENILPDFLEIHMNLARARCGIRTGEINKAREYLKKAKKPINEFPEFHVLRTQVARLEKITEN